MLSAGILGRSARVVGWPPSAHPWPSRRHRDHFAIRPFTVKVPGVEGLWKLQNTWRLLTTPNREEHNLLSNLYRPISPHASFSSSSLSPPRFISRPKAPYDGFSAGPAVQPSIDIHVSCPSARVNADRDSDCHQVGDSHEVRGTFTD